MTEDISIGDLISQFKSSPVTPPLKSRGAGAKTAKKTEPKLSDADQWFEEFKNWLAADYESLVHPTRKPGLHASGLGSVCGRRSLVIEAFGAPSVPNTAGNYLTYDVGHSAHAWWQERYLGPKQELWGDWKCMACRCPHCEPALDPLLELSLDEKKEIWDQCDVCRGTGRKVTRGLMPMDCSCGTPWQDSVRYMELPVINEELNYVGHTDGILVHGPKRRLFELKTMSPSEHAKLVKGLAPYENGPHPSHVVQAHAYMEPLGLDEALIVYLNKGSQCKWTVDRCGQFVAGEPKVSRFIVKWNQELWDGIVARISDHHRAMDLLKTSPRPSREDIMRLPRVCSDSKCMMAQRCPVSTECFSDVLSQ